MVTPQEQTKAKQFSMLQVKMFLTHHTSWKQTSHGIILGVGNGKIYKNTLSLFYQLKNKNDMQYKNWIQALLNPSYKNTRNSAKHLPLNINVRTTDHTLHTCLRKSLKSLCSLQMSSQFHKAFSYFKIYVMNYDIYNSYNVLDIKTNLSSNAKAS